MSTPAKEGAAFEPAITFEDVWVGFDEGQVLRGVTFQVQERETLILLGETGTGKTLTLKMAAGLLAPKPYMLWSYYQYEIVNSCLLWLRCRASQSIVPGGCRQPAKTKNKDLAARGFCLLENSAMGAAF